MEQIYQIHNFNAKGEVENKIYVVNHSDVVYSVNVYGTGETYNFENREEALQFAKDLYKTKKTATEKQVFDS